jgi:hypothetical protein
MRSVEKVDLGKATGLDLPSTFTFTFPKNRFIILLCHFDFLSFIASCSADY